MNLKIFKANINKENSRGKTSYYPYTIQFNSSFPFKPYVLHIFLIKFLIYVFQMNQ